MNYDTLRPYLSRIIAPIITALLGYLSSRLNLVFDENTNKVVTEGMVLLIIPIVFAVNGIIHKTLDKWINPGDSASKHLAKSEAIESTELKLTEDYKTP